MRILLVVPLFAPFALLGNNASNKSWEVLSNSFVAQSLAWPKRLNLDPCKPSFLSVAFSYFDSYPAVEVKHMFLGSAVGRRGVLRPAAEQ